MLFQSVQKSVYSSKVVNKQGRVDRRQFRAAAYCDSVRTRCCGAPITASFSGPGAGFVSGVLAEASTTAAGVGLCPIAEPPAAPAARWDSWLYWEVVCGCSCKEACEGLLAVARSIPLSEGAGPAVTHDVAPPHLGFYVALS